MACLRWRLSIDESGQLILARDAFGEKPLYYAELAGGGLAFASELQALEAVPNVGLQVSLDAVAELLMFQYIGAPRTIYSSVRKLPPGHWLIAYPGQAPKIGRYFAFRPGSTGFDHRPVEEMADELEEILVRSLRRRLVSDVPLGAFLSGGVDSSTVCALIRRRLDVPLKTFSIGFQGASESEHEIARAFAEHLGTEHHDKIIAPNTSDFLLNIGRVLDEPNADSSCLPTYLLSAFARETVTVALSGDGGDEMFAGYDRYFATLDESRRQQAAWRPGDVYYSNRILVSVEEHIRELLGFVPAGVNEHVMRLRGEVNRTDVPLFCRLRQTDVDNYMPGAVLPKVDRMSMQHSLEVRTPFLSIELARFAERLPQQVLYNGARGKLVLREIAYRYLPRNLVDLPKKGFGLPISRWGQNELLQAASSLLESSDSRLAAALGRDAIARFMQRQKSHGGFVTYQVWALTMLESWLRNHPAQIASSDPSPADLLRRAESRTTAPSASASVQIWKIADGVLAVAEADVSQCSQPRNFRIDIRGGADACRMPGSLGASGGIGRMSTHVKRAGVLDRTDHGSMRNRGPQCDEGGNAAADAQQFGCRYRLVRTERASPARRCATSDPAPLPRQWRRRDDRFAQTDVLARRDKSAGSAETRIWPIDVRAGETGTRTNVDCRAARRHKCDRRGCIGPFRAVRRYSTVASDSGLACRHSVSRWGTLFGQGRRGLLLFDEESKGQTKVGMDGGTKFPHRASATVFVEGRYASSRSSFGARS